MDKKSHNPQHNHVYFYQQVASQLKIGVDTAKREKILVFGLIDNCLFDTLHQPVEPQFSGI